MIVGLALLGCVQQLIPGLSAEAAVQLDWGVVLPDEENLAALYTLSTGLKYIWEARLAKKVVMMQKMRAEIEAKVTILEKSSFLPAALKIEEIIQILKKTLFKV